MISAIRTVLQGMELVMKVRLFLFFHCIEKGVCICWDDHSGIDCNYSLIETINLYVLMVFIVLVSIISFLFMYLIDIKVIV